ncbi:MAG: class I adenylate-forming enzyme family protein [Halioglobus sp.]
MNIWTNFQKLVATHPERPALIHGDFTTSFSELSARVFDYRHHYQSAGVRSGDRVLIWTVNQVEIAAAIIAAWGEGAIAALMDSSYCSLQLQRALGILEPRCVVYQDSLPEAHFASGCSLIEGGEVLSCPVDKVFADSEAKSTDPATIVFTSGSTGGPRGVTQSHGNLLRGCNSVYEYLQYQQEDRILCPVPWSFDYGFGQLLSTVICGLTQVLPGHTNSFGLGEAIERHQPTVLAGTPTVYGLLTGGMSPIAELDVSSIRLLTSSGGKMPGDLVAAIARYFSGAELSLNYGLTETYRSCYLPTELAGKYPGAIGYPIPGVEIAILRANGVHAEAGEVGEIVHLGDYIMLGYWNDAAGSELVLKPYPLNLDGNTVTTRALYTGDMGYRDSGGLLYFVGRADHQLKSMGVKVNPTEVEGILHGLEGVEQAAVFGIEHSILGDEIWAAYVPDPEFGWSSAALRIKLAALMSPYMLPRQYLALEHLPKNVNGKVSYSALREMAVERSGPMS